MGDGDQRHTESGIPIQVVYGPADLDGFDPGAALGEPGHDPFTRGIYPTMYRGRAWTMRQYAGFGSAAETNARFRYLLDHGQTGLSVAFDLPTQMGYDSDHPMAAGEVGKVGVAIDSLADMRRLFEGIPLDQVSTSMTINAPAAVLLLLYQLVGEEQGVDPAALTGTVQNDVLKEYIARGTYIYPPVPSLRITTDLFAYCAERLPRFNTISISGYHMAEAGATAAPEIALTPSHPIPHVQAGRRARRHPVAPHQRLRRGPGPAQRGRGPPGPADPAGPGQRDRGHRHGRPAGRVVLRGAPDRRGRGRGPAADGQGRGAGRRRGGDRGRLPEGGDRALGLRPAPLGRAGRPGGGGRQPLRRGRGGAGHDHAARPGHRRRPGQVAGRHPRHPGRRGRPVRPRGPPRRRPHRRQPPPPDARGPPPPRHRRRGLRHPQGRVRHLPPPGHLLGPGRAARSGRPAPWAARPGPSSVVLRRLIPIQPGSNELVLFPHPGGAAACPTRSSSSCTWPPSSASCWRRSASAPPGPAAST